MEWFLIAHKQQALVTMQGQGHLGGRQKEGPEYGQRSSGVTSLLMMGATDPVLSRYRPTPTPSVSDC